MSKELIKLNSYISAIEILNQKNNEYDILIDFHDRKKWIASTNITVTLISPKKYLCEFKYNEKKEDYSFYVRDKTDNSIIYICGKGRYEYYSKGYISGETIDGSSYGLSERVICRDNYIGMLNQNSDTFVDNGTTELDYDEPYIDCIPPHNKLTIHDDKEYSNSYIIEKRSDGGIELYDSIVNRRYICNIGKRYEYYFKGEFKNKLSDYYFNNNDILIKLLPDKNKKWVQLMFMFDPNNNPFIVRQRDDGGVDLLSKEDGSLKYICNIGKRFYYIPFTKDGKGCY